MPHRPSLALILCAACARPAPPSCVSDRLAAVPPDAGAAAWVAGLYPDADVVLLGEFHGLVQQIELAAAVLALAPDPLDLAVEVLPASRQAELDALAAGGARDASAWARVIGGKYHPLPLTVAEYGRLSDAVAAQRRAGRDVRLIGLAPPCSIDEQGGRDAAIDCLERRDALMAETLLGSVTAGRRALALAGFAHVDLSRPETLAGRLAAARPGRVASVLLDGPFAEVDQGAAWELSCDGLFRLLDDADPRADLAVDLRAPAFAELECDGARPSRAYTGVVSLPPGATPTALPPEVFAAVSDADLARWNDFEQILMGQNRARDRDGWARFAVEDAASYGRLTVQAPGFCDADRP